jgi:hypothetical protein
MLEPDTGRPILDVALIAVVGRSRNRGIANADETELVLVVTTADRNERSDRGLDRLRGPRE